MSYSVENTSVFLIVLGFFLISLLAIVIETLRVKSLIKGMETLHQKQLAKKS
ncbi:MAG: hypothetical protein HQL27_09685, partial [Candidatus Omnitrophica bacterium]|nr:hypothetical protein [Candidatus Omnitrophota bacterium]